MFLLGGGGGGGGVAQHAEVSSWNDCKIFH